MSIDKTAAPPAEAERIEQSARVIASAIGWSYDDLHEDKQAYIAAGGQGVTDVNGPYKADLRDAAREVTAAQRPAAPVDRETLKGWIDEGLLEWVKHSDDDYKSSREFVADAILAHLSAQPRVAVLEYLRQIIERLDAGDPSAGIAFVNAAEAWVRSLLASNPTIDAGSAER